VPWELAQRTNHEVTRNEKRTNTNPITTIRVDKVSSAALSCPRRFDQRHEQRIEQQSLLLLALFAGGEPGDACLRDDLERLKTGF